MGMTNKQQFGAPMAEREQYFGTIADQVIMLAPTQEIRIHDPENMPPPPPPKKHTRMGAYRAGR